ncbi:DNA mismatch repair protein MutS [Geminisphaera colitermitum]|uniref:DNA mismatch repair protein MutS n=1 Tax=Geminisphaera colitermitum TaxID=1148786 RepID=UPI0005B84E20|nr:DNA mismatch repair protein MutS [Geminisphaera colitermitum]
MTKPKLTPMQQQYFDVKRGLAPDVLLLFRLGDFYEMFYNDAVEAARLLGLTLAQRNGYPMAGVPYHAADTYINKLLAAGRKVAICDQDGPVKPGKLVRRQLTRILSPGTTIETNQLDAARNRYVCALNLDKGGLAAAWLDLSTGEFKIAHDPDPAKLLPVLTAIAPAEVVIPERDLEHWQHAPHDQTTTHALHAFATERTVTERPAYLFETLSGARAVMEGLGVLNLQGFGLSNDHPALGAAGALIQYATDSLCARPENLRTLQEYRPTGSLLIDPATLRNLEIFQSTRGTREGSLITAIDRTTTAPGARLLERWLASPTLSIDEIRRRSTLVGELIAAPTVLTELRGQLGGIRDIPRILGRLQNRLRNPRELGGIRDTLAQLPAIADLLKRLTSGNGHQKSTTNKDAPAARSTPRAASAGRNPALIAHYQAQIQDLPALRQLLASALADELPSDIADGGFIRSGHDAELDRLHSLTTDNRTWLSELERAEQERTGIKSLKVRFTNNFGYYIEVTKANLRLVPDNYIRRQTTVNGERYITDELREKEKEILHAEESARERERELLTSLVTAILDESLALTRTAEALAELDVLAGWAILAREWGYSQPEIDNGDVIEIIEGRHPVVEQMIKSPATNNSGLSSTTFVPNDTTLSSTDSQLALLTGPNMAGKSTYIRQVALITLLAQIGCWVPAKTCRIGLVDRIFSRVGASDDLARGNSTFMVEMNETANILNNATDRSLIILDEIGRGTSTYDGLSIAWAVVEHLHADPERGPRTLFATHYQELTQLEKHLTRLRNYSVAVKEWNDEIVFVRRVVPGAADRSYGIQVARLAGLPASVIERAKTILAKLEGDDNQTDTPATQVTLPPVAQPNARPRKKITVKEGVPDPQLAFF